MDATPIIISAVTAFTATLSAGLLVKKLQNHIGIVCAFAAGFFIALSLFDLLPEVMSLAIQTQASAYLLLLTSLFGFVFLFALERGFGRLHLKGHKMANLRPKIGLLSTAEFCSHAYLEGLAIGLSFQLDFNLGIFIAVAVISHDFCDGISTLALMLNSGNTVRSSLGMLIVAAVAPILGALTTLLFTFEDYFLLFALTFLLGSFLYMGAGSLLPDAYRMNRPAVTTGLFLFGFLLI